MRILLDDKIGKDHALNANEACVYAAISKCSNSKGWYANYEVLASSLPFVISAKTVSRAVKKLISLGIVEERQNVLYARTNCPQETDKLSKNPDKLSSPHTPLYKNINIKEKQADMQTDFEKFWNFFSPAPEFQNRRAATEMIFETRSLPARKAILNAAQIRPSSSPPNPQANPYFFVQDFPEPQPHNYNGDPRIDALLRAHQVAPAEYNGKFGMYSLEDIQLFHLRRPEN